MKKIHLVFLVLFLSILVTAQTRDDARFLEKSITYTLNPDGSWQKEYFHRVRLDSHLATNRLLGESFILYNPRYQELTVLKSETIMKEGKTVNSPDNAFNPVLPRNAHGFPRFSHLREMVITHTGLERGAVVTLHYRLKTRPGFMPYFSGREPVGNPLPVDLWTLRISVPSHKKLRIEGFPEPAHPEVNTQPDRIIHTFRTQNLKGSPHEPQDGNRENQYIFFSTAESWETVFPRWETPLPIPGWFLKKARDIKNDTANVYECYQKLQELVAGKIDLCTLGMGMTGFQLRSPEEIITSNYGTAMEKTRLLQQLLAELNIPAQLVAIPLTGHVIQDVPSVFQFNGFLLKIKKPSPFPVFLNPAEKAGHLFPYSLEGSEFYDLNRGEIGRFDQNHPQGILISGTLEIDKDGTRGNLQVSLEGRFSPYVSCLKNCQSALTQTIEGILPVSQLEITGVSLLTPAKVVASVKVEGNFLKALYQNRLVMKKYTFPGISHSLIQSKTRQHSLYLAGPLRFEVRLSLKTSPDFKILFTAPPDSLENESGRYSQAMESLPSGEFSYRMCLELKKSVIGPSLYPEFRKVLSRYLTREPLMVVKKTD